jgi:hypothetical protein
LYFSFKCIILPSLPLFVSRVTPFFFTSSWTLLALFIFHLRGMYAWEIRRKILNFTRCRQYNTEARTETHRDVVHGWSAYQLPEVSEAVPPETLWRKFAIMYSREPDHEYTRAVWKVRGLAAVRRCYASLCLTAAHCSQSTYFSNGPRICCCIQWISKYMNDLPFLEKPTAFQCLPMSYCNFLFKMLVVTWSVTHTHIFGREIAVCKSSKWARCWGIQFSSVGIGVDDNVMSFIVPCRLHNHCSGSSLWAGSHDDHSNTSFAISTHSVA